MGIIMLGTISFQLRLLVVWLVLSAVVIAVDLLCLRLRHIHGVRLTLSRHSAWLPGRRQLCAASSSLLALASMFCEHVEPRRACCAPPAASASFNCTMSVTWLHSATRSLGEHGSNLTLIVDLSIGLGCASTIIGGRRRCPSIEQRGGGIHAPISR